MKKLLASLLCAALLCACLGGCGAASATDTGLPTLPTAATGTVSTLPDGAQTPVGDCTLHISEAISENGGKRKSTGFTAQYAALAAQDVSVRGTLGTALVFDLAVTEDGALRVSLKNGAYYVDDSQSLQNTHTTEFSLQPDESASVLLEDGDRTGYYRFSLSGKD